jgi:hypothetical protein
MKRDLDFNIPFNIEKPEDIIDKLAIAVYNVLHSEALFYLAMQGANERGFQLELFKHLNRHGEFQEHVELEFPVGKNRIDMVIFKPGSGENYKKDVLCFIEFKHYSVIQNIQDTLLIRNEYLESRVPEEDNIRALEHKRGIKLSNNTPIICIELVLDYDFVAGTPPKDSRLLKKYRFPLHYDFRFTKGITSDPNNTIEDKIRDKYQLIRRNFNIAIDNFYNHFKDQCRYAKKTICIENEVNVTLHIFISNFITKPKDIK